MSVAVTRSGDTDQYIFVRTEHGLTVYAHNSENSSSVYNDTAARLASFEKDNQEWSEWYDEKFPDGEAFNETLPTCVTVHSMDQDPDAG